MPQELLAEFKEAFSLFDKDPTDGSITAVKLGIILRTLGQDLSPSELKDMVRIGSISVSLGARRL